MIQNLFDKIEEKPQKKSEKNETAEPGIEDSIASDDELLEISDLAEFENRLAGLSELETIELLSDAEISPASEKSSLLDESPLPKQEKSDAQKEEAFSAPNDSVEAVKPAEPAVDAVSTIRAKEEPLLFQSQAPSDSIAETARKSGLAWAAAITLFGSVVFCLIIGWFADLLLGTSPWGVIGGIALGSIVGFLQFFRMTSQIFRK